MAQYMCPNCRDVVAFDGFARVTWCNACGQPLTMLDLLPVRPELKRVEPQPTEEAEPPTVVA